MTAPDPLETARDAILSLVPIGYGMTRAEAATYARAAIRAYLLARAEVHAAAGQLMSAGLARGYAAELRPPAETGPHKPNSFAHLLHSFDQLVVQLAQIRPGRGHVHPIDWRPAEWVAVERSTALQIAAAIRALLDPDETARGEGPVSRSDFLIERGDIAMAYGRTADARRQAAKKHTRTLRKCPRCGREIRGNAYANHKAACKRKHAATPHPD